MIEIMHRPRKRLFLTLILISLCIATVSSYGIWVVSLPGLANISTYLPMILGVFLATVIIAIACGVSGIILAILGFRTLGIFQGLAWSAINLLFPMAISIGKLFDLDKERIERSFIEVSNHLIKQKRITVQADKLLIMTPHCLQQETCPYKITRDVSNCHRCGKCQIGDLVTLATEMGRLHFLPARQQREVRCSRFTGVETVWQATHPWLRP
jgi:predicted Zn-ribbon and HTH transcriptional regulator